MKTCWVSGQSPERAIIIKADFEGSGGARERLVELVQDKIRVSNTVRRGKDLYSSPSWAYLQADAVGYERALFEVISLISEISVE